MENSLIFTKSVLLSLQSIQEVKLVVKGAK